MRVLFFFHFILIFMSCDVDVEGVPGQTMAYVPVYAQPTEISISVEGARSTQQAGKIYAYNNYIFQNDVNKGVHIIDNSQPNLPQKIAFINIPFSTELAVKGRFLYVNSISDLLVLDLQDPEKPVLTKRIKDAFPVIDQNYPPFSNIYFVCPDASKGIVVGWELKSVKSPACRR